MASAGAAGGTVFWALVATFAATMLAAAFVVRRQLAIRRRLEATLEALTTRLDEAEDSGIAGVLTRSRFDAALDEAVRRCDAGERALSVLFVGLDRLDAMNDAFGHVFGERALARTARALRRLAGDAAALMRPGGESLALLIDADRQAARRIAQAVIDELAAADGAGGEPPLGCSIGIASYPEHGSRARVLAHAATAMRHVRQVGGGDYALFDPVMAVDLKEQSDLLRDLRHAVERGQLELVYQPKVDAHTLQITAAEALARWHHPQRGLIGPSIFIPLAERFGLIGPIGNWVIDEACRQAGVWRASGLRMRVAINVSAYQMRQDDLVDRLQLALSANGLSAHRFTCEITESVAMEDTKVTQRTFEAMRRLGLHVSIDDFGVGQASLSYLRRLPAAELKIDASFVRDLASNADAKAIVDAVIKLAHALQLRVVAEGVETEAQRDLLVQMGCDELQGYLFARPMSAKALSLWAAQEASDGAEEFSPSLFRDTLPLDGP